MIMKLWLIIVRDYKGPNIKSTFTPLYKKIAQAYIFKLKENLFFLAHRILWPVFVYLFL